jgi:hypothetical protein
MICAKHSPWTWIQRKIVVANRAQKVNDVFNMLKHVGGRGKKGGERVGTEWGKSGERVGTEWGKSGNRVGKEWGKSGNRVGKEWGKSGNRVGKEWGKRTVATILTPRPAMVRAALASSLVLISSTITKSGLWFSTASRRLQGC